MNVPLTIQEKIWKGEFIELYLLIKKDRKPQSVGFKMEDGFFYLQAKNKKDITDIGKWTKAFHIFMTVVLQKEPYRADHRLNTLAPTPIKLHAIPPFLHKYPSPNIPLIESGFQNGFPLHFQGPSASYTVKNHRSAFE